MWINPVVKGLPTVGYTTRVEIGRDKKISYASGFLGDLSKGDTYPLITAREAFDELPAPMTDMMCRRRPERAGLRATAAAGDHRRGARARLQQTSSGDQLLVPAWLFAVKTLDRAAAPGRRRGQVPRRQPEQPEPVGDEGDRRRSARPSQQPSWTPGAAGRLARQG